MILASNHEYLIFSPADWKLSSTSHERFVLEIDPERRIIEGTAELTVQPLDQNLKMIRINSRQCHIRQASVNNIPAKYAYTDAISELSLGSDADVTHHQSYKSKYLTAMRETDDGELAIELPENVVKPISELEAQALANGSFMDEESSVMQDTPDTKQQNQQRDQQPSSFATPATPATANVSYAPLTIRIDYTLIDPRSGIAFVEPDPDVAPYRYYHVYTVNQPLTGGTRAWVPCIDRLSDQCTWDMEFVVPQRMGTVLSRQNDEDPFDDEEDTMVVCSGEIMEQIVHPADPSKKIVHYSLAVPTAAPFIGFAVGPFHMIKLTPSQLQDEVLNAANLDENQQQSLLAEINMMSNIYAFALPGQSDELTTSCSFLMHAMHFYGQEYGSYPYTDYKIVFVEDAWNDIASSASLSICSSHLLHSEDIIDQIYTTRRTLSKALARQWFGVHIVQKSWPDIWLVIGLSNYMAALFIKRHLGNNEYRLRLKMDMDLCCSLDINRPPLYNTALPLPLDPDDLNFIELKAPLVLYMLDRRMCKGGSTLGFSRVIPKILVSAMSGELANNALSTHHFLRLCRKISGFDTRVFADQWIYKSGCPRFNFSYHFNRKKMVVEIFMWQENTNVRGAADNNDYVYTPFFTGNFIVRVHEADGTPYEHILEIQSQSQKFEVQFNTKYKRIRRNTKRFIAKQAAAAAAVAEDDPEKDEDGGQTMLDIIPMLGLGMPVFEDEEQRQEWRIVEWGQDEDDTSGAASATFDWIRLDAEFEWLCILEFQQPDYMWAAQLTKDRDVVAQHEAIGALKRMPSLPTSTSLLRAVLDPKTFYKIRMEAACALASCATSSLRWAGLLQLFKAFQKRFCFPLPPEQSNLLERDIPIVPVVPKPNNFSNLPDYFLQKGMVIAFSEIRDETGLPPLKVRQFLLDLLKYNDNTGNEFSDSYYVATLISAVGDSVIPIGESHAPMDPETEQVLEAAKAEIDRFRTLDYVVPSYHNVVTIACLQTITKLMLNGLMDIDLSIFLLYTRYGNYFEVRCTAFDSLFALCGLLDDSLVQYFISIIKYDPSTYISHYVARAMLAWLGLAIKEKISGPHDTGLREEFAEEEGKAIIENDQQKAQRTAQEDLYTGIEELRKRFEANKELQQTLWDMLYSSENLSMLDHCTRKYILQLCEYLYKPIDSGLKVTIRMPTAAEQPIAAVEETPAEETHAPILRLSMSKPAEIEVSEKKPKKSFKRSRPETTVPVSPPPSSNASPEPVKPSAPALEPMPADQLKSCRRILGKLQKHRSAILFLQPVDEALDGAPDYYKIIKEPMDLGTVKTKLDRGLYSSFEDFESDIRLIFHNCFLYNRPGTYVYNEGQALEAIFDKELATLRGKEETQNMTIVEGSAPITASPQPVREKTDMEKCEVVLSNLMENQHAFEFLRPVDPIKQGIPYYFDIIKHPMDLGTVKAKLRNREYSNFQEFDSDIRLMFRNCYTFNPPNTYVYNEGKVLEEAYDKEWKSVFGLEAASPSVTVDTTVTQQAKPKKRKTEKTEMEKCRVILSKVMDNKHALPFLEPVDPVKLNIPQYFEIIKHPMDLSTVKKKLDSGQYANRNQFDEDIRLMLSNCYTFNPPDSYVHNEGKQLEKVYEKQWSKQFKEDVSQQPSNVSVPEAAPVAAAPSATPPPQPTSGTSTEAQQQEAKAVSPAPLATVTVKPAKSDMEKCADVVEQTMQDKHSAFFLEPVDPVKLNVPQYFDIIKHPMDLGTIKEKLNSGQYSEPNQVNDDVRLMFNNCYTFNPPKTFVHEEGKLLEKAYERFWKKAFGTKPPGGGSRSANRSTASPRTDMEKCAVILEKIMQNRHASAFLLPVDPIALNIPHYFEVIKHPMDLSTIKKKLENHEYSDASQFDSDVRLILQNCFTFNPPNTFVHNEGKLLEKAYEREWKKWFK